ncbi:uncharacterized protein EDB93DRAFT_635100 [Suillus bovinus]|uniref:uncharacterized protein n=1 Tax=Suillus bovinus TaxID=48563 RepID=UPI001B8654CD|nr:uncharacterized protein EDB93DRAFT_635100 [Suillus bovinus]KAG2141425.1 hypothetical protein EDB93DRAFT_635100 [Suillus bovinus]
MFVRFFTIFVIFLLFSKAYVMAAVMTAVQNTTSSNSTSCGDGERRCCMEDSSLPGNVNDEECQSCSGNCSNGYVPSCCYVDAKLMNYYYCEEDMSS